MLKFQCSHCGGRLAVQERNLSRLAQCPDCGGITHPMAEQIIARDKQEKKKRRLECDNCGHALGRLQKPRRWGKSVVCAPCYRALAIETIDREQEPGEFAGPAYPSRTSVRTMAPPREVEARQALLLAVPQTGRLPGPSTQFADGTAGAMTMDLRAGLRSAAAGVLLAAAGVIVVMYIIKTVGYLILWSAAIGITLVAGYAAWRGVVVFRRRAAVADGAEDAGRLSTSVHFLSGAYSVCCAAKSALLRGLRTDRT